MRVVQVNYAFDPDLPSASALLDRYTTLTGWANALARAGTEVLTVQQFQTSSNVTRDRLPYTFGTFNEIAEAATGFRPDVVHVNGLEFARQTWVLRRWCPRPIAIVVQDHASQVGAGAMSRALRPIRRRLMSVVDAFLFSTPAQADPWRAAGLIGPRQGAYDVMEASTTLRALERDEARSLSGVTGDPAAVWIGRLNANKDPLTVLDAFEHVAARRTGATLTMIFTDADLLDAVRARVVGSATLRDRVRLAGDVAHDRIAAFLSAADIFVVGSHHEGSGYALMEALACGAMPVVTDIPAFRILTGVMTGVRHHRSSVSDTERGSVRHPDPVSDTAGSGVRPSNQVSDRGSLRHPDLVSDTERTGVRHHQDPVSDTERGTGGGGVGYLWTPGDPESCARAFESAATQPNRQRVIDHFEKNLTWEAVGRRAVEIYRDVISNTAHG